MPQPHRAWQQPVPFRPRRRAFWRRLRGSAQGGRSLCRLSHRRLMLTAWIALALLVGYAVFRVVDSQTAPLPAQYAAGFRSCDAMRAAGLAPATIGSPAYAPHLDADGDGVACEPWVGSAASEDTSDRTVRVLRVR